MSATTRTPALCTAHRGTLWSDAGNALDVASLGVALMRASGIPAQYVEGTLSYAQAQTLILSMFPASYQTVGYIPSGTQTADPADDPQLQSETQSHYWFEINTGNGWVNADPLMPGTQIGQTFTAATGSFTEVAQSLRQTTEVSLTAELYYPGFAAIIGALNESTADPGFPAPPTQSFWTRRSMTWIWWDGRSPLRTSLIRKHLQRHLRQSRIPICPISKSVMTRISIQHRTK